MVIVKIWGGLGNQLFQYSFGKYLAAKLGTQVKYDIQTINNLSGFTQRDFVLSFFNVHADRATAGEINEKKYFRNIHLARLERKVAQQIPALFKKHVVEHNVNQPAETLPLRDNCYYEGYWQSYKYLTPIEDLLRKELTLKIPLPEHAAEMLFQIEHSPSASIHVRRSDYVTHAHFLTCTIAYYKNAISYIKQFNTGVKFYVFSDDIAWCKENFTGAEFVFIEGNSNYGDLYLMSKCNHNIIANSTFSWWAAWLNTNPQKIVVAPGSWHKKKDGKNNELLPGGWIKMAI